MYTNVIYPNIKTHISAGWNVLTRWGGQVSGGDCPGGNMSRGNSYTFLVNTKQLTFVRPWLQGDNKWYKRKRRDIGWTLYSVWFGRLYDQIHSVAQSAPLSLQTAVSNFIHINTPSTDPSVKRNLTPSTLLYPFNIAARWMHKRGLWHRAVSVCLSVTFVYCVETSKHYSQTFSPSGRSTILASLDQTLWQY